MSFPFTRVKIILLDQEEYGISSEKYLINYISEHMSDVGLMQQRLSDNDLFFIKMNPFNFYRKGDVIRNMHIIVDCATEGEIKITLRSSIILLTVVFALGIVGLILSGYASLVTLCLATLFYTITCLMKFIVLNEFKSEITTLLSDLKQRK